MVLNPDGQLIAFFHKAQIFRIIFLAVAVVEKLDHISCQDKIKIQAARQIIIPPDKKLRAQPGAFLQQRQAPCLYGGKEFRMQLRLGRYMLQGAQLLLPFLLQIPNQRLLRFLHGTVQPAKIIVRPAQAEFISVQNACQRRLIHRKAFRVLNSRDQNCPGKTVSLVQEYPFSRTGLLHLSAQRFPAQRGLLQLACLKQAQSVKTRIFLSAHKKLRQLFLEIALRILQIFRQHHLHGPCKIACFTFPLTLLLLQKPYGFFHRLIDLFPLQRL